MQPHMCVITEVLVMAHEAEVVVWSKAVEAVFNRWSLLNLAIDEQFADDDSWPKAEWFYDCVLAYCRDSKEVDVFDLDEYLQDFLAEEFHCEAEDGSTRQIAEIIVKLYKDVAVGDLEKVQQFTQSEMQLVKTPRQYYQDPSAQVSDAASVLTVLTIDSQDEKPTEASHQTAPDEDGWEVVRRRKR